MSNKAKQTDSKFSLLNKIKKDKPAGVTEKVINLIKILDLLEKDRYPSRIDIADACEVSIRTVQRYIQILKYIVPIQFNRSKGGYEFENKITKKTLFIENKELALLTAILSTLKKREQALYEIFENLIKKLYLYTKQENSSNNTYINLTPDEVSVKYDSSVFKIVMEALSRQETVKIVYKSIETGGITKREIDPYELYFHDGEWFVYAFCHLREEYRWFALDGIKKLEPTTKKFSKPDDFSLEEKLKKSFYIFQDNPVTVRVRFFSEIANKIKRKKRFHKIEKRQELEDGSILITFEVAGLQEIKSWLYGFIPYFEVIEPKELRDIMRKEIEIEWKILNKSNVSY